MADQSAPIEPIKPSDSTKISPHTQLRAPNKELFNSYMQKDAGQTSKASIGKPSPMEIAQQRILPNATPTPETLKAQAQAAQKGLNNIEQQLQNPLLQKHPLSNQQKYFLTQKLNNANTHLEGVLKKMNAPIPPETNEQKEGVAGPLGFFLNMLTTGQNRLKSTQDWLAHLSKNGQDLTTTNMLQIQIKLNRAQQEIEFSSMMLSKTVDSIKMLMNVQL